MTPGPGNRLTDVAGLRVGHAENETLRSGVTVVLADAPMVAGVHVMGGAPGTRETDLLRPEATVPGVDALVLSGGSAFGLAAADGVVAGLRAMGRGFEAAGQRVPIVPTAILFDLNNGGEKNWDDNPYPALGRRALDAASAEIALGSVGAGAGATIADLRGGLGTASAVMASGATVGALVAVNALGQATVGDDPHFWAAPFEIGAEYGGLGASRAPAPAPRTKHDTQNTTIAVVATDLRLSKAQATRMAIAAHDGMARALVPSHTPMDGDLVFSSATGYRDPTSEDLLLLSHTAATCLARAIARGIFHAAPAPVGMPLSWGQRFG